MIEMGPWFLGKKGLVIKRWEKTFSPKSEYFNLIPTWVSLPELQPYYWNPYVIVIIAKGIGSLITIERSTRLKFKFTDARFVVNLDISKSMIKKIKLKIEDGRGCMQPIVYENMPVQCVICKSYEHYAKDFQEKKRRDEERREKEKNEKESQDKYKGHG